MRQPTASTAKQHQCAGYPQGSSIQFLGTELPGRCPGRDLESRISTMRGYRGGAGNLCYGPCARHGPFAHRQRDSRRAPRGFCHAASTFWLFQPWRRVSPSARPVIVLAVAATSSSRRLCAEAIRAARLSQMRRVLNMLPKVITLLELDGQGHQKHSRAKGSSAWWI